MDDLKRDTEALRIQLIAECERWMFEPTEWERALVAEIQQLPAFVVPRLSEAEALGVGMLPKKCHRNTTTFARCDPDRKTQVVAGWFRQAEMYLLHSVILREGRMQCVTPMPRIPGDSIDFIPDPSIEWRAVDGRVISWRNGREVGIGVRANPERTLQQLRPMLARLRSGMRVDEALGMRRHAG